MGYVKGGVCVPPDAALVVAESVVTRSKRAIVLNEGSAYLAVHIDVRLLRCFSFSVKAQVPCYPLIKKVYGETRAWGSCILCDGRLYRYLCSTSVADILEKKDGTYLRYLLLSFSAEYSEGAPKSHPNCCTS